jgi:hypothetical protein
MSYTKNGRHAFPIPLQPGQSWQGMAPCDGLSMRDWYAGMAVQGLLSDSGVQGTPDEFAQRAFEVADAMIKRREQQ